MKNAAAVIGLLLLLLAACLSLWPVPIEPETWVAPTAPGYGGSHAVNHKLAGLKMISLSAKEEPSSNIMPQT